MRKSNYDNFPFIAVPDIVHECAVGWDKIAAELQRATAQSRAEKPIIVVDCYPGVDELEALNELGARLAPALTIQAAQAYHAPERVEKLMAPFLDCENPIIASSSRLSLVNFFNAEPLWRLRRTIDELKGGLVLIVGCGASLIAWGHIFVYADLTRREARRRLRQSDNGDLAAAGKSLPLNLKSQSAFLVDRRIADRWKRPLIRRWDYVLDTNSPGEPKLAQGEDVRRGLGAAARQPFRTVPFFDPASPDDQSTGAVRDQDSGARAFGWNFDPVLEENSLLLGLGGLHIEIPAIDLVFNQPQALLGETVYARFGHEFPIRFDFMKKVSHFEPLGKSEGWREERAGSDERAVIETRRHWFSKTAAHDTRGSVNVLNLVEGDEAIVESPDRAFGAFLVHHAETFIVPAAVGRYDVRPHGPSAGKEIATITAFVKT